MAAASNKNADDMVMSLVEMGFEFEDAMAAIENNKTTAQEAIDWILAGKPAVPKPQPVLKLGPSPVVEGAGGTDQSQSSNQELMDTSGSESQITTRLFVSEEQYQAKLNFERKQAEEARKKAVEEKNEKRKAREQALKRIQDDREMQRMRNEMKMQVTDEPTADTNTVSQSVSSQLKQTKNDTSSLQIRLVDGKILKQSFPSEAKLEEVKTFVKEQAGISGDFMLIQPFPHIEYGDRELSSDLRSLGLVPSGSIVVKKTESQEAAHIGSGMVAVVSSSQPSIEHEPIQNEPIDDAAMDDLEQLHPGVQVEEEDEDIPPQNPPDQDFQFHPGLGWGRGRGRGGFMPQVPPIPGFNPGFNPGGMGRGRGMNPFPPGHGHGHGQPGGVFNINDHDWGSIGQRLVGDILNDVELPHQRQDPVQLAAEAARRRFDLPPVNVPQPSQSTALIRIYTVPSLLDMTLSHVCARLSAPSNPITGLHGIPADLADKILEYLIKEKLLKPNTLDILRSCRLRRMVLDCYAYCTNGVLHALRNHIYLKHISLASCSLITDKGLEYLAGLRYLKFLSLAGCRQMNNACVPTLIKLTTLESLILENTSITDSGVIEFASSSPPNLQHLSLKLTDVTQAVIPALQSITQLKKLSLEQTKIGGLSGIQNLTSLTDLNIAHTQVYTDSMLCLKDLSSLKALNISSTPNLVGDMALQFLAGLKLKHLELPERSTTTDNGIQHLAGMPLVVLNLTNYIHVSDASMETIGSINTIRVLNLSNTKVGDAGMVFLAGLVELEELYLDKTVVSNVGANIVSNFPRLRVLSLASTCITNGWLRGGAVNLCQDLTSLNISRTNTSEKGLVYLKLPELLLLNIDETYAHPDKISFLDKNLPFQARVTYKKFRILIEEEEAMVE